MQSQLSKPNFNLKKTKLYFRLIFISPFMILHNNCPLSLMDWKIIMFDHEGVKTMKVIWSLSIFFSRVKSKIKVIQNKYEVEGHNM